MFISIHAACMILYLVTLLYSALGTHPPALVLRAYRWYTEPVFPTELVEGTANAVFFVAATMISFKARRKHVENKKIAPLLLSMTFFSWAVAIGFQLFGSIFTCEIADATSQVLETALKFAPFLFLSVGVLFVVLFVIEIFEGGVFVGKNRAKIGFFSVINIVLICMLGLIVLGRMFVPISSEMASSIAPVLLIAAVGLGGIGFLASSIIQVKSSVSLLKKTREPATRRGIMLIGIAGLILIGWFASELTEAILWMVYPDTANRCFAIDVFMITSSVLLVLGGILVYSGYIYPAMRTRDKNN
ncbi:MAG: hypothetical protein Q6353_004605 [Candidatus Sigynarchaeum springense]